LEREPERDGASEDDTGVVAFAGACCAGGVEAPAEESAEPGGARGDVVLGGAVLPEDQADEDEAWEFAALPPVAAEAAGMGPDADTGAPASISADAPAAAFDVAGWPLAT
jgi:hypothetical protein